MPSAPNSDGGEFRNSPPCVAQQAADGAAKLQLSKV